MAVPHSTDARACRFGPGSLASEQSGLWRPLSEVLCQRPGRWQVTVTLPVCVCDVTAGSSPPAGRWPVLPLAARPRRPALALEPGWAACGARALACSMRTRRRASVCVHLRWHISPAAGLARQLELRAQLAAACVNGGTKQIWVIVSIFRLRVRCIEHWSTVGAT
jgi:hypothetical protein